MSKPQASSANYANDDPMRMLAHGSSNAKWPDRRGVAWWIIAWLIVFAGAITVRAWIQFRGDIPPAIDPAYYPVQAWWLFNQGRLLYQDAPLIFVLDGALANGLIVIGMQSDRAYLVASQLVDCITEPWVSLFIFLFGYAWCGGARRGIPVVMAGAILAVLSAPVIRMVSDFEKNSLGLVWAAMSWWALWRAIEAVENKRKRISVVRWFCLATFALALAALTHGGSFGAALLGAVLITLIWFVIGGVTKRTFMIGVLLTFFIGALSMTLLYVASPSRAQALFEAPMKIFGVGDGKRDRGPPPNNFRDEGRNDQRGEFRGPPPRMGARGMGPPGGSNSHGTIIGLGVGLCAFVVVGVRWSRESIANRATIIGLASLCIVLVFPLLNPEYAQRLNLMASVPVGIVFTFLAARLVSTKFAFNKAAANKMTLTRWPLYRTGAAWLIAASVSYGAIHSISGNSTPGPVLSKNELQELFSMREQITNPLTTLVVAEHGLQWWAGYALHTPVRMGEIPKDAIEKYSRVLILKKMMNDRRARPSERLNTPENAQSIYKGQYFELLEVSTQP